MTLIILCSNANASVIPQFDEIGLLTSTNCAFEVINDKLEIKPIDCSKITNINSSFNEEQNSFQFNLQLQDLEDVRFKVKIPEAINQLVFETFNYPLNEPISYLHRPNEIHQLYDMNSTLVKTSHIVSQRTERRTCNMENGTSGYEYYHCQQKTELYTYVLAASSGNYFAVYGNYRKSLPEECEIKVECINSK